MRDVLNSCNNSSATEQRRQAARIIHTRGRSVSSVSKQLDCQIWILFQAVRIGWQFDNIEYHPIRGWVFALVYCGICKMSEGGERVSKYTNMSLANTDNWYIIWQTCSARGTLAHWHVGTPITRALLGFVNDVITVDKSKLIAGIRNLRSFDVILMPRQIIAYFLYLCTNWTVRVSATRPRYRYCTCTYVRCSEQYIYIGHKPHMRIELLYKLLSTPTKPPTL